MTCKGLIFRYKKYNWFWNSHQIRLECRESFRLLKKESCPGCKECEKALDDINDKDLIIGISRNPVHGQLYKLKVSPKAWFFEQI